MVVEWIIPDVPYKLKERIRREAYVTNEIIVNTELMRARGEFIKERKNMGKFLRRQRSKQSRPPRSNAPKPNNL